MTKKAKPEKHDSKNCLGCILTKFIERNLGGKMDHDRAVFVLAELAKVSGTILERMPPQDFQEFITAVAHFSGGHVLFDEIQPMAVPQTEGKPN